MKKLSVITLAVLVLAGIASATSAPGFSNNHNHKHQCTPEPITMFALIPGAAMLLRRRNKNA